MLYAFSLPQSKMQQMAFRPIFHVKFLKNIDQNAKCEDYVSKKKRT